MLSHPGTLYLSSSAPGAPFYLYTLAWIQFHQLLHCYSRFYHYFTILSFRRLVILTISAVISTSVAKQAPLSELARTLYFIFLFALSTLIRIPYYSYLHSLLLFTFLIRGGGKRGPRAETELRHWDADGNEEVGNALDSKKEVAVTHTAWRLLDAVAQPICKLLLLSLTTITNQKGGRLI